MLSTTRPLALLFPLSLMACVEAPMQDPAQLAPLPTDPTQMEPACGAAELQDLIGRDAAVLQTMRFGQTVRIIRPGMAVTMDYSPQRLNILIDEREIITRVSCG